METKTKIEKLAQVLFEIHGHSYKPFYPSSYEGAPFKYDWNDLIDKASNSSDIDKKFFIEMAKHVLPDLEI